MKAGIYSWGGGSKEERHGFTEEERLFVPARSASALPSELLRCSYYSDKWSE